MISTERIAIGGIRFQLSKQYPKLTFIVIENFGRPRSFRLLCNVSSLFEPCIYSEDMVPDILKLNVACCKTFETVRITFLRYL